MRNNYKIHDTDYPYFITSTIVQWIPIFTTKPYFDIIIDSLQHCQQEKDLSIFAFVIMDNHIHLIAQAPELGRTIQAMKRHTASCIIKQLELERKEWLLYLLEYFKKRYKTNSEHQIWQEGNEPKEMTDHDILLQKMTYIHYNPVKRGWVAKPEDWLYSSARNYFLDDKSLLQMAELMPF